MESRVSTRRRVADTALELPMVGMGTAHIGELYGIVDEGVAQATFQAGWDGGVRYYDTAPWYGRGLSEHRLGGFLRTKPRKEFFLTTKVGRTLHRPANAATFNRDPWKGGLNFEVNFNYSYDGIMRSYEQALQRLALDTVDALVIHDLDSGYHDAEALRRHTRALSETGMKALAELKSSGDIKAFGMGINMKEQLADLAQRVDLDFVLVAMPYTLIDQESLHTGRAFCVWNSGNRNDGNSALQLRRCGPSDCGESPADRGYLRDTWCVFARCCASIPAGASSGGFHYSRSRKA